DAATAPAGRAVPSTAPAGPSTPTAPGDHPTQQRPDTGPGDTPIVPTLGRIPAYPAAERAVRALAEAVKYAQWRRQAAVPGKVPEFLDDTIDEAGAAARIDALLGPDPDPRGRSLGHDEACELLGCYGITVRPRGPPPPPPPARPPAAPGGASGWGTNPPPPPPL
ncbi:acyl-CoA synthetase, partial [Streptomyces sp. NPDC059744]